LPRYSDSGVLAVLGREVGGRLLGDTPRPAVSPRRDRTGQTGFDHIHSLVDDHFRPAYSEVLADEKGPTCAGFLARAAAYFSAHGIDRIERKRLTTPGPTSGPCAKSLLVREPSRCSSHRTAPGRTGKSSAFNRTLQTDWAYRNRPAGIDGTRPQRSHTRRPPRDRADPSHAAFRLDAMRVAVVGRALGYHVGSASGGPMPTA
jgi:hypothetical protein